MTDEFSIVTDGNRESFIHETHTERSPITPINLNKTQVCQSHPSPPHHVRFLGSISKATSCMLLWDCILTLCSLRHFSSSARSLCCLLLALMGCPSHMAQVIGGPAITWPAWPFILRCLWSQKLSWDKQYIYPGFDPVGILILFFLISVTVTEERIVLQH